MMKLAHYVRIGTAGWTIPSAHAAKVASDGSHLQRYARALTGVEINSTFYRLPRAATLTRWAAVTPSHFRFAFKMPKAITHDKKLRNCGAELVEFFAALAPIGEKLGPVLVQLPPKLAWDEGVTHEFFTTLREVFPAQVVLEPRHASWFSVEVDRMLRGFDVARAMADPPKGSPAAAKPGGSRSLRYYRLHGAPKTYWSAYDEESLRTLAQDVATNTAETWVIFDNTAQGHALGNALQLRQMLHDTREQET